MLSRIRVPLVPGVLMKTVPAAPGFVPVPPYAAIAPAKLAVEPMTAMRPPPPPPVPGAASSAWHPRFHRRRASRPSRICFRPNHYFRRLPLWPKIEPFTVSALVTVQDDGSTAPDVQRVPQELPEPMLTGTL